MPFAFSMKPLSDLKAPHKDFACDLQHIQQVIEKILDNNSVDAAIKINQYKTDAHCFAVYFVKPKETDAAKNKELIAALRQVINNYIRTLNLPSINIFLVLANAQTVIEEHLAKIGARKLE